MDAGRSFPGSDSHGCLACDQCVIKTGSKEPRFSPTNSVRQRRCYRGLFSVDAPNRCRTNQARNRRKAEPAGWRPHTAIASYRFAQPNNFRVHRSVADIPDSVRSAFAKSTNESGFLMADPNGRWEATDVIRDPELPRRRLASVAISGELCLLFYEHRGIGKNADRSVRSCQTTSTRHQTCTGAPDRTAPLVAARPSAIATGEL